MNGDLNNPSKDPKGGWGRKWTRTEIFLAISLAAAVIYFLYYKHTLSSPDAQPVDVTLDCCRSIIKINDFVDPSIDPCSDFHEFACGNFFKSAHKRQVTAQIIQEQRELEYELESLIVDPILDEDSQPVKFQKMFFHACSNLDEIDADEDKAVLQLIEEIGGWPLLKREEWRDEEFDWMSVMIKCRKLGLPFQWFLEFGLHADDRNFFKISYPALANTLSNINQMVEIIASLTGKKIKAKEFFDFERRLLNVTIHQKSEISIATIEEMQEMHPTLDWLSFLNNLTEGSYEFTEETEVASNVKNYILELHSLLTKTPKNTQANYIVSKIIEYFIPYMSSRVRRHLNNSEGITRSEFCKEKAKESFPYLSEVEYIRKYSTPNVREPVSELANLVREEFLKRLNELTWWNTTASEIYYQKYNETVIEIGCPDDVLDEEFLDYLHTGNLSLQSDEPTVIQFITARSKAYYDSKFSQINETAVDTEEKLSSLNPIRMSVMFDVASNKMMVSSSLLHGFLYDSGPKHLNYGSLGSLIAKEFVRSIQVLPENDRNKTDVPFESSNKCLKDYSNTESEQEFLENAHVVQEIISDAVGRDIAYGAYQTWVEENGEEAGLPLLPYNPNQFFWIKSSLINCHKKLLNVEDEEELELMLAKYKNILSVKHSRHFGQDFACPIETPMNPEEKC